LDEGVINNSIDINSMNGKTVENLIKQVGQD
jgi:hypothetical protein